MFVKGEMVNELKEDIISRYDILGLSPKINKIAFFCARVRNKYPFNGIWCQLGCIGTVVMNKGKTTKHQRRHVKETVFKVDELDYAYFLSLLYIDFIQ